VTQDGGPSRATGQSADRLVVAYVRGVHGLAGAIRVEVLTDHPDDRFALGSVLFREGDDRPLTIAESAPESRGWRLRFDEVRDRDSADTLRDAYLEAAVPAPDGEPGSFYWHDVVGAVVRDGDGRELGSVIDVYRVGENEAFVVQGGPYGEFDVPAVRAFVRLFDPKGEGIVVDVDALDLRIRPAPSEGPDA
jgi:16S rRNA processing protein RimM